LNLGGFSSTRKNLLKIGEEGYTLDEVTSKLGLTNFSKTSSKQTDRSFVTLTRVCVSYADSTRIFLQKRPEYTKFSELKDLGFVYSWACSDLKEDEIKKIYVKQLDLMISWVSGRNSNPKRFPEKMELFYILVRSSTKEFFAKIREDYEKNRKVTLSGFWKIAKYNFSSFNDRVIGNITSVSSKNFSF